VLSAAFPLGTQPQTPELLGTDFLNPEPLGTQPQTSQQPRTLSSEPKPCNLATEGEHGAARRRVDALGWDCIGGGTSEGEEALEEASAVSRGVLAAVRSLSHNRLTMPL
jgi:hypothetical protein